VVIEDDTNEECRGAVEARAMDDGDVKGTEGENADIISPPRIMKVMTMTSVLHLRDIVRSTILLKEMSHSFTRTVLMWIVLSCEQSMKWFATMMTGSAALMTGSANTHKQTTNTIPHRGGSQTVL
jgi:hypothetical protein